jgi:Tfp pilus assembly protein PilV
MRIAGDRAAFTMIEALIAVVMLAFFVVGVCAVVVAAREVMDRSRSHYTDRTTRPL